MKKKISVISRFSNFEVKFLPPGKFREAHHNVHFIKTGEGDYGLVTGAPLP